MSVNSPVSTALRFFQWTAWTLGGLILLASVAFIAAYFWRPGMDAYAAHRAPAASPQPAGAALTITWFGVTAVLLSDGVHSLMLDPFFSRPSGLLNLALNREIAPNESLIAESLARAGIQHLDAVLVSHSHYDHAMDAGVVARLTGAQLLGSPSTLNIGRSDGVAESSLTAIAPGVPLAVGAFRVTFIESQHAGATGGTPVGDIARPLQSPRHYLDYKLGGAYSILIEHAKGRLLHHGSAGFIPGALKPYQADTVLLGVALIDDLPEYLRQVVDAVGARRIVPIHWDDFTRPLDEPLQPTPLIVRLDRFFDYLGSQRPEFEVLAPPLAAPFTP